MRFSHWSALAIIVGLSIVSSPAAAEVVYSGPVNIPITPDGNGTTLNLLTGQVDSPNGDWDIQVSFISFLSGDPWVINLNYFAVDPFDAALEGVYFGDQQIPLTTLLHAGDTIGPSSSFLDNPALNTNVEGIYTGPLGSSLLGLRLANPSYFGDTNTYYAWIRLNLGHTAADGGTIVDYAIETTPDTPILAGIVPTPEPSSFVLGALAIGTLTLWRWRRVAPSR